MNPSMQLDAGTSPEAATAANVPIAKGSPPLRSIDVRDHDPAFCMDRLHAMLRVRRLEERCAQLYTEGRIRGFLHLLIGEEAVTAGLMPQLTAEDNVVATYREHGHALLRGVSMEALMAEMFGKQEGCSRGRGGSMHLFDRATRFYGGQAIVAAGLPLAVGLALADRMSPRPGCITACFFGEGAVAEGAFHESLNLAALWQLPVLFICENNLYAMGTALARSQAQIELTRKAQALGVDGAQINGMNVLAVHAAALQAVARVRSTGQPFFLELHTYRFRAHSMFDAELYRDKAEVERWKRHDPIATFIGQLRAAQRLSADALAGLERQVREEVEAAVACAEAGHWEPEADLLRDVRAAIVGDSSTTTDAVTHTVTPVAQDFAHQVENTLVQPAGHTTAMATH